MERLEIPEGILDALAHLGDGHLWFMASVDESRFEPRLQGDFGADTVVRFETGEDGSAEAMILEVGPDD